MAVAARLLRQSRRATRLSQRDLSALSHVRQPAVADVESSAHDPAVERLDRLVAATGHRLAVLPTRALTVADIADEVFAAVRRQDRSQAFRLLVQLNDELVSETGAVRVALAVTRPASTGDPRYDAYIAALVEYHLAAAKLPVPDWVHDPSRVLETPWRIDRTAGDEIEDVTPPAFRRRRVFVDEAELLSV